jgi:hypothetical protein
MSTNSYSKKTKLYLTGLIIISLISLGLFVSVFFYSTYGKILLNRFRKEFLLSPENINKWVTSPGPFESPIRLNYTFLEHLEFDKSNTALIPLLPKGIKNNYKTRTSRVLKKSIQSMSLSIGKLTVPLVPSKSMTPSNTLTNSVMDRLLKVC